MKHAYPFLALTCALCLFGCQNGQKAPEEQQEAEEQQETKEQQEAEEVIQYAFFEYDQPVDLSDLYRVYDWVERGEYDRDDFDSLLMLKLFPDLPARYTDEFGDLLFENKTYALRIPEYKNSPNPFLAQAESFYNSCALAHTVWSDYESLVSVYTILDGDDESIAECRKDYERAVKKTRVDYIADEDLREGARQFRDSMALLIAAGPDGDVANRLFATYSGLISQKAADYLFYEDREAFIDSLKRTDFLLGTVEEKLRRYQESKEHQVRVMLEELCSCQTFDEQCALWRNWANCPPPMNNEDRWIAAVGCRLMSGGRFSPILDDVWTVWRAMMQPFFGFSISSDIPNVYYNIYRKKCYVTCLKHIERFPNDPYAMNSAAVLYGYHNMSRFGFYGNAGYMEYMQQLGQRFKKEKEEK